MKKKDKKKKDNLKGPFKKFLRQTYGRTQEEWEKDCAEARRRIYKQLPWAKEFAEEHAKEGAKTDREIEDEIIKSLERALSRRKKTKKGKSK